jgi:copper transport protein
MSSCSSLARTRPVRWALSALLGLVAGVLFAVVGPARPAAAHAVLVASSPADGAVLDQPPPAVVLRFSEDISPRFSSARLVGAAGRTVAGTAVAVDPGDRRQLTLRLPAGLRAGSYGVAWRVLAEDDGHTTSGVIVFAVGGGIAPGTGFASRATGTGARPLDVALRWLGLCLLAGVAGALAVAFAVVEPGAARRRLYAMAAVCAGAAVPVALASLAEQAARSAGGRFVAATLLVDTRWGNLWLVRAAALAALVPLAVYLHHLDRVSEAEPGGAGRRLRPLWTLTGALVLALVVVEALGSHAASVDQARTATVVADALHILGACFWLGGIGALLVLAWPGGGDEVWAAFQPYRARFGWLAGSAVALLVLTGLFHAGREVGSVASLGTTTYGRTLVAKSALLLVGAGLGLVTWLRFTGRDRAVPRWLAGPGAARGRRVIIAEAAVGAVILMLAGVLAESSPPRTQVLTPIANSPQHVSSATAGDLLVSVTASPNRPGVNAITVLAASNRRPPPAAIRSVTVEITGAGGQAVALQQVEPGRYVGTTTLGGAGPVQANVIIQRGGKRLTVPVGWSVSPAAPAPASPAPRGDLAGFTDQVAGVLLGAMMLVALWWFMVARPQRRRPRDGRVRPDTTMQPQPDDATGAEPELASRILEGTR